MNHIIAGFQATLVPMKIGTSHLMLWHPYKAEEIVLKAAQDAQSDDKNIPYWAILWPASIGLAEYLSNLGDITNRRVLELGAGLALPSLIAAKAGANVLMTDLAFEALIFAEANASANKLQLETKLLDWNAAPENIKFDIILGADILYEQQNQVPVLTTIGLLLAKGGKVLLSDPNRFRINSFVQLAESEGWKLKSIPMKINWENGDHPLTIWELKRDEA